jgi:hypothetical protein
MTIDVQRPASTPRDGLTDVSYWDGFWGVAGVHIGPSRGPVRDAVREAIVAELSRWVAPGQRWVEIGCANSNLLYDFPHRLHARLDGVDSAAEALEATGAALERSSIDSTLRLHDFRELADVRRVRTTVSCRAGSPSTSPTAPTSTVTSLATSDPAAGS